MNKERVLFLVFHNRCHRVILGFHQFFHQLVIEVAANFTGSVENHGCFIPWGACRPVREGWGFRASVAGKVDPGGGHTLLQTVCFARDIAYGDAVDVMEYERRHKEKFPVLAICYDFDKTLSPDDMQAQGYIQSVGYNINEFWKKSNDLAADNDMDTNLAYMYTMKEEAEGNFVFSKKKLAEYGAKVKLFNGVEEWFERIRAYGKAHGVIVEHYIISSGLKEMIEGTSIAKNGAFEKIYASSFYYNKRGVAVWPAQVINYTSKTQFLFRIEKGTLDINDSAVNEYFPPDQMRVPFRNIVYIGDSDTDIPCMKLVNSSGGHSIGVYNPDTKDKKKVLKMIRDNRIKHFAPADYSENGELDQLVKAIIDKTAAYEVLESQYFENLAEARKE